MKENGCDVAFPEKLAKAAGAGCMEKFVGAGGVALLLILKLVPKAGGANEGGDAKDKLLG